MSRREQQSTKRQEVREQRARHQRRQRITLIAVIVVVALVFVGLLAFPSIKAAISPVGDFVKTTPVARPNPNFNSMGDPNAPVKMVEFSDYQCPYCKMFSDQTEKQIVDAYVKTGKVYFTYWAYGPGGGYIGPESEAAINAAFCAGEQNKFWEFHDMIFANQTGENVGDFTDKRLTVFAKFLNLDMSKFNACFSAKKYADKIKEGIALGTQVKVQGTPSFTINGKLIEGAVPFAQFKTEIDAALAAAGGG